MFNEKKIEVSFVDQLKGFLVIGDNVKVTMATAAFVAAAWLISIEKLQRSNVLLVVSPSCRHVSRLRPAASKAGVHGEQASH